MRSSAFPAAINIFFPGVGGPEVLNFFHWLGAVITNPMIIGNKWTPVRQGGGPRGGSSDGGEALLLPGRRQGQLAGIFAGTPEGAWDEASELVAQVAHHLQGEAVSHDPSCAPPMYDELWVGRQVHV